ncbi:MAG TPA: PASTA domain-containing protein [Acidimicrobiales bacterium]|nr:PASTA domain-containing protein [Acidimicrobiales bacterium]
MSPSASQDAIGLVIDNRYRLVAKIGIGTSATVYLADDVRLRRRVAVKVLAEALAQEPAFVERFGAEMQAASALRHPHIGMIHDWGVDDAPYVVGEYFANGSLRRLADRPVRLSPSQALQLALASARALAYAHERGVVHRNLNPSNLLFADDARLKITDFGLTRAFAEAASTQPMGAQATTGRYASPEQARGSSVDGRADVYALALIVVEAVSGRVPFAADTALATLMARIDRAPEIPPELGAMAGPLGRATTVDPADRLDAGGLVTALMAVADAFDDPDPLPLIDESPRFESDPAVAEDLPDDITVIVTPGSDHERSVTSKVSQETEPTPGSAAEAAPLTEPANADDADDRLRAEGGVRTGEPEVAGPTARPEVDGPGRSKHGDEEAASTRKSATTAVDPDSDASEEARRNHRRWRVAWAVLALVVVVGGGAVGYLVWQAQRTPTHLVPSVAGLSAEAAQSRLEALGFDVGSRHIRRDGTTAGELLGVDPASGTRLSEGDRVTLTVSRGQSLVTIPGELAGDTPDAANEKLTRLGLVIEPPTELFSEDVEQGRVIGTEPAVGERIEKGSAVSLVVSKGPQPRVVPEVSGMSADEAQAALRNIGLVPEVTTRLDPAVDKGGLIGLDPGSGTSLPRGAQVTVVVSSGLSVIVPSLDGVTTVAEAIEKLQQAGLVANNLTGSGSLSGRPVAFDPPAGQVVAKGSPVNIVVQ